jgi:hypothetical protein
MPPPTTSTSQCCDGRGLSVADGRGGAPAAGGWVKRCLLDLDFEPNLAWFVWVRFCFSLFSFYQVNSQSASEMTPMPKPRPAATLNVLRLKSLPT